MTHKEIKKALMTAGTILQITTRYGSGMFNCDTKFKINRFGEPYGDGRPEHGLSVSTDRVFGNSMNVNRIGTRTMELYDYNMLGRRSKCVVRFDDIIIVSVGDNKPISL